MKLEDIKVAIFDFDNTLAIHQDKDYVKHKNENEDKLLGYFLNAYLNPDTFYEEIEPCFQSEKLKFLVNELRKNNVKLYCVSGMKFSFQLKAKENFVHKHYGEDIELISTGTQELKIDAIKIIRKINNCKLNEILFVDEQEENIKKFNELGIKGILPINIGILLEGDKK